ncbi:trimethylamine--corrinoid methyltransferase [Thermanaerovibrio acidaminovorans]|jgi:hypothetical protein|uniref:trimethylamine--corrinoid methyltransferase n=1 Tax=Thermanaerovibrio acidaminovorans TaxID=81462 RepID=UPI00249306A9|nr:trimethylamine--corrinoid methyltransferase [Thermanaerovibrio acidaminovorans]
MAYKGPSGLWGAPDDAERHLFVPFQVEVENVTCWIQDQVLDWMERSRPSPEGDYLFFVEGVGRLRFRLVEDDVRVDHERG